MNVEEVAALVNGVSEALGGSLKGYFTPGLGFDVRSLLRSFEGKPVKEFTSFVESMRRLVKHPGGSVKEFVAFVEKAFSGERDSVPALIERMNAHKAGTGESLVELQTSLKKLPVAPLKSLAKALGVPAGRVKNDTVAALLSWLSNTSATPAQPGPDLSVDRAVSGYRRIREIEARLAGLSIESIRRTSSGPSRS